jgi:hypothetical protein
MNKLSLLFLTAFGFAAFSLVLAKEPSEELFNGKDLKGWKFRGDKKKSRWVAGKAELDPKDETKFVVTPRKKDDKSGQTLVNAAAGVDLLTEKEFGDCAVNLEFMVPKGSNSGVYLMGEYEVQILDSFGKDKLTFGDVGGIYNTSAPKLNAAKKPGQWQEFIIHFKAPRFDEKGKKIANAKFLKVLLNGKLIQENVEVKGPTTSSLTGKEKAKGPLMLQGDHGPVAFRDILIVPKAFK